MGDLLNMLAELIALIGAAELDNLIIGTTAGANGAPFWLILTIDLVLTAVVLLLGNFFGGFFENYSDTIMAFVLERIICQSSVPSVTLSCRRRVLFV